jgi:serine protease Do
MQSILRFFLFLALLGAVLSALWFWRAASKATVAMPDPAAVAPVAPVRGAMNLQQMDREFQELVARIRPSVVSITAENSLPVVQQHRGPVGTLRLPPNLGSGVLVSAEGHIVTNLHVIQQAQAILVHLFDGRNFPARVLGADPLTDIAILKIDAPDLFPAVFGNSDEVRPGQMVFAIGNPYGLQETVTQGIISGIGRRSTTESVNEFFQTDTAINPGNSGGPLIDLRGEVIGINNHITSQTGGWQGIGFSIPANTAKRVYEDIRDLGRVQRSWFGIAWSRVLTPALANQLGLPDASGVLVQYTVDQSPAARAGLQAGDVITEFQGRRIADGIDLRNRIAEAEVGQEVAVKFYRDGQPREVRVKLEEFPGHP